MNEEKLTIAVSGGFDPIHPGHIKMFGQASKIGTLVVIVNSDEFLIKKKGYRVMPLADRIKVIKEFKCVSDVIPASDEDGTVAETIRTLSPHVFANGGDRSVPNEIEDKVCREIGCSQLFGLGGYDKMSSSSDLMKEAFDAYQNK